jgi:hypothetical protein
LSLSRLPPLSLFFQPPFVGGAAARLPATFRRHLGIRGQIQANFQ